MNDEDTEDCKRCARQLYARGRAAEDDDLKRAIDLYKVALVYWKDYTDARERLNKLNTASYESWQSMDMD